MSNTRLIRLESVMNKTGLSRTGVYSGMKKGTFPAGIKISKRCVAWDETKVNSWISEKINQAKRA